MTFQKSEFITEKILTFISVAHSPTLEENEEIAKIKKVCY